MLPSRKPQLGVEVTELLLTDTTVQFGVTTRQREGTIMSDTQEATLTETPHSLSYTSTKSFSGQRLASSLGRTALMRSTPGRGAITRTQLP